jgi:flagellin-like protein
MSEKGISEIIATILMLMITIGLAGTAFIYISGFLKGTTEKRIALLDVSCVAGSKFILW